MRELNLRRARRLGARVSEDLPLLGSLSLARTLSDVVDRSLCLHVVSAHAHGFDARRALAWAEREGLRSSLSAHELQLLQGRGDALRFREQVEANLALAWALGIADSLEFDVPAGDDFVTCFPELRTAEPSASFRSSARLRDDREILEQADLAYCLHWSVREAALQRQELPGAIAPHVVVERHRALTWLFEDESWDDISLDT